MDNEDVRRLLLTKRVEKNCTPSDDNSYFVDGAVVNIESGLVPCSRKSETAETYSLILADGPYTGMEVTVAKKHVSVLGKGDMSKASDKLFGSNVND